LLSFYFRPLKTEASTLAPFSMKFFHRFLYMLNVFTTVKATDKIAPSIRQPLNYKPTSVKMGLPIYKTYSPTQFIKESNT